MSLLYKDIADKIIDYIESHPKVTKLPTERELSIKYQVSRQTIRKAVSICEEKGLIEKRQGSGLYLSSSYLSKINHVALMVPDSEDYIYPQIISELESRYQIVNYTLSVYSTFDSIQNEKKILEYLINNPVSTLLVMQTRNVLPSPLSDKYQSIKQKGTNIIFLGNPCPNLTDYSYIKFDDFYSGYSSAKRITNSSKNWFAIFVSDNNSSMDRYYGFIQCMEDINYEYNENYIHWITYDELRELKNGNNHILKKHLTKYQSLPSVYICGHDEIAYSLINYLNNIRGITEEMKFYSFDNSYLQKISSTHIYSYNGDKDMLYSKIIELTLSNKKQKEVITLPSALNG